MLFPVLSDTSQHQLLGVSTVSAVIFFLFPRILKLPELVSTGHKRTFFDDNHSNYQAHPTNFSTRSNLTGQQAQNLKNRLGATDDEMMFKCWKLGSCSFNGWLARWSSWLISFLEPYHVVAKGMRAIRASVMCKFEDFWKTIVETTSTGCFCCLLLFTAHINPQAQPQETSHRPSKEEQHAALVQVRLLRGGKTDLPFHGKRVSPSPPLTGQLGFDENCGMDSTLWEKKPPGTTSEMKIVSSWLGFDEAASCLTL